MLFLALPVLSALGFTAIGPAAGSIAAAWQSAIGVGAVFTTLQSAAMGGYGAAIVAQGTAAVVGTGVAVGVAAMMEDKDDSKENDGSKEAKKHDEENKDVEEHDGEKKDDEEHDEDENENDKQEQKKYQTV